MPFAASCSGQRQVERLARPGERDLELRALELAHRGRAGRLRPSGPRGEEARDEAGELVDAERVGRRAALELQARQPEREVEGRVADARVVPVDEDRAPAPDAEVVAPHVAVEKR